MNAAAKLILKIKEKHKIPSSVVESVVQDIKELLTVSLVICSGLRG